MTKNLNLKVSNDKRGRKPLSGPDKVTLVIAAVIYSSSPPLFLAPRVWMPRG